MEKHPRGSWEGFDAKQKTPPTSQPFACAPLQVTLLVGSCPDGHSSLCPLRVSAFSLSPAGLAHLCSRMTDHRNTCVSVLPPTLTLTLTLLLGSRLTFTPLCFQGCLSLPLCPSSGGCFCPLPRTHPPHLAMLGPKGGPHTTAQFHPYFCDPCCELGAQMGRRQTRSGCSGPGDRP